MYIKDTIYGEKLEIWCRLDNANLQKDLEGSLQYINNKIYFKIDKPYEITFLDNKHTMKLDTYFARRYKNFAYISHKKGNKVQITIIFFAGHENDLAESINISFDKNIIDILKKEKNIQEKDINWYLFKECVLNVNNEKYIQVMNHHYYDSEDNESLGIEKDFVILGKSCRLFIQSREINKNKYFIINKLTFTKSINQSDNIPLLIKLKDITFNKKIEILKPYHDKFFQDLINNKGNNSYINVWEKYTGKERENVTKKAKCILKCNKNTVIEKNKLEVVFENNKSFDEVESGDELVFIDKHTDKVKDYIQYINNMSDDSSLEELEKFYEQQHELFKDNIKYKVDEIKKNDNIILLEKEINKNDDIKNKYAIILLSGSIIQLNRKITAIKRIREGKSSNPMLRFLIEDGGFNHLDNRQPRKIKALSSNVLDKVFKHNKPTPNQIEAIKIALNTPDIALIQGPPGTGKTTVINAVLERLNEEYYKQNNNNAGRILVTAFQHDAVDNIVSKLKINAIPGIKFGGKKGDENNIYDELNNFCNKISENIKKHYHFDNEKHKDFKKSVSIYLSEPTKKHSLNLLYNMLKLDEIKYNSDLVRDIKKQIEVFEQRHSKSQNNADLNTIYAIRLDEKSFKDDGIQILSKLEYNDSLHKEDKIRIAEIKKKAGIDINSCLEDLRKLKEELLDRLMPDNEYRRNKLNNNILKLIERVEQDLKDNTSITDKKLKIVYDFKEEIENNRDSVINSLKKYSVIFSSTIQQSQGKDVYNNKKNFSDSFDYDVVVVDEAARANPMDLFVAICNAKNKIILVGDHRQLPHIVDEDLKQKLEQGEENTNLNLLDISIFEYLLVNIKKLEEKDGIKRIIALNTQYRSHNILGDFINKNFYEKHNHNESFTSHRKYGELNIDIADIKKPCIWYNIQNSREEKDSKGSRFNEKEIEIIKNLLTKWTANNNLKESIGVISFYKAQAEKIKKSLSKDSNIDELIQSKQIEIGTVDAFQGKEFDIILLSLVRCGRDTGKDNIRNEALFGHLMSENRLCVAMSRAKKVLAVIGNSKFMSSERAKEAVPALYDYVKLCMSEYGEIKDV